MVTRYLFVFPRKSYAIPVWFRQRLERLAEGVWRRTVRIKLQTALGESHIDF